MAHLDRNAGTNVAQSQVPAITFVGLVTIAVVKGSGGEKKAVTEKLEENSSMNVLPIQVGGHSFS